VSKGPDLGAAGEFVNKLCDAARKIAPGACVYRRYDDFDLSLILLGLPTPVADIAVMCLADLIDHLGTLTRNAMRLSWHGTHHFTLYSTPTRLQETAFRLLKLEPLRVQ
jgi:hypothetical protein